MREISTCTAFTFGRISATLQRTKMPENVQVTCKTLAAFKPDGKERNKQNSHNNQEFLL